MNEAMTWSQALVAIGGITFLAVVIAVVVVQVFKTGRTAIERNASEETREFQEGLQEDVTAIRSTVTEMDTRLAEVERLLKSVE